jgi:hypothetical protein
MGSASQGSNPRAVALALTMAAGACTFNRAMAVYAAHTDAFMPAGTGTKSWRETNLPATLAARINVQRPSGY